MPDSQDSPYRSRRGRGFLMLLLLLLLAGAAYWFYTRDTAGERRPSSAPASSAGFRRGMQGMAGLAVPVRIATSSLRTMDQTLRAIGTVNAFNTVVVRSRVDGELLELNFQDGQSVEQGDVLARIDPRSYQVQLDQALGQQAQTQAQLKNAEDDLRRYQQLFKQQSIARQQLDTQAALVDQLRAAHQSNQAAIDSARLQLGFTEITAPISGRLGLRQLDVGNLVNAGAADGLVTITQVQPISVRFSLAQADLAQVQAALRSGRSLPVDVYGADDTRRLERGELLAIDNQIDVATGTVELKAGVPNTDESLFPNQFVNVRLHVDSGEVLAIPAQAIQYGSIGAFVYVVDEHDKVSIREIVPGRTDGRFTAVTAGLALDERVVIEGVDRLREGSTVEIVSDAQAGSADTAPADLGVLSRGG